MNEPLPQEAIDSLPDNYVLLGWGGEFDLFDGDRVFLGAVWYAARHWWASSDWTGDSVCFLYAAPNDSEIVALNRKAGKLPILSEKTTMIPDKKPLPEEKTNTIYVAGPMRGVEYFNFPAFDAATASLTAEGWNVISPADIDREHGFDALDCPPHTDWNDLSDLPITKEECFDRDIDVIRNRCGAIYMLKGWQNSTGAQAEYWCAKWLGLGIHYEPESICEEAFRIQGGDRQQDYGDPTQNFSDIADLWETYLHTQGIPVSIEPRDVAHMMILMKIARNCHKPKRDNWVDIAGYSQCGGKIDKV